MIRTELELVGTERLLDLGCGPATSRCSSRRCSRRARTHPFAEAADVEDAHGRADRSVLLHDAA